MYNIQSHNIYTYYLLNINIGGWVSLSLLSLPQYKISRSNEIRVESAVVDIRSAKITYQMFSSGWIVCG